MNMLFYIFCAVLRLLNKQIVDKHQTHVHLYQPDSTLRPHSWSLEP